MWAMKKICPEHGSCSEKNGDHIQSHQALMTVVFYLM
jgi:hypothetical protein